MIAAYSSVPQSASRSERSFGTWQGRLPPELRLAKIDSAEGANRFLREEYIQKFNGQFSVPAAEKGTAFRRTGRSDLNWIFSVQTERVVAKDNTVAIRDRLWQIDKSRFRHSLAGITVTIHEHLDETVSIRYGPHIVGRFDGGGNKLVPGKAQERCGKGGSMEAGENQKQVSSGSHTPLGISPRPRDSHFPTAPTTVSALPKAKTKTKTQTQSGGLTAASLCFTKRTNSLIIRSGQLDLLTAMLFFQQQASRTRCPVSPESISCSRNRFSKSSTLSLEMDSP